MSDQQTSPQRSDGTVGKALEALDMVAGFGRPVRFSELTAAKRFPKATLFRLLQTLTSQDMLSYDPETQCYAPGLRLVRLAHSAWRQSSLAPIARAHIDSLAAEVGETVHLAQLDNGQVLYVDKRNAREPVEMFSQAGKIGPAYCTGVGKAMLAFLDDQRLAQALTRQSFHAFTPNTFATPKKLRAELARIRARGFATDDEEHEPGIICVALPILNRTGRVLGALSVTSTTGRTTLGALESLAPRVGQAARDIARDAENWQFPEQDTRRRQ